MPTELPIACTLSATELPARLAQMAELGRDALVDVELSGPRATLRFAAGKGVRDRITSVVVAESACCAFLTMDVSDEPDTRAQARGDNRIARRVEPPTSSRPPSRRRTSSRIRTLKPIGRVTFRSRRLRAGSCR